MPMPGSRDVSALYEQRLADFFDTAAIALHWVGPDGMVLRVNQAELDLLGYSRDEYLGRHVAEFHADPPVIAEVLTRLTRGEKLHEFPARLRHKDGSIREVLISSSVLFEDGKFIHTRCFTSDVTARLRAERALAESQQQFREMINALPVAIYTTDAQGRLTHFNPAAVEFSGRTPRLGTDEWCVTWKLHNADGSPLPHDQCPMAIALKENRTVRGVEAIAERPDGKRLWFMAHPTPLRDAAGRVTGGINMLLDITERKRNETLLAGQKHILEQLVSGAALSEVLESLCTVIERQSTAAAAAAVATILLADEGGKHLRLAAGRRCPPDYCEALGALPVGPSAGSCGTAAFRRKPVVVADIAGDSLWLDYREIALRNGLRACWSVPIFSAGGEVLGTFAVYHGQPGQPEARELVILEGLAHTASVAIERHRAQAALQASEARYRTLLDQAPLGVYLVDADFRIRDVNPTARQVFGDIPDLYGRDFDEVMHILWPREYADEIVRLFRRTMETGEPYVTPERGEQRRDRGVTEYYEWRIDRIALPDGRYGVVCYFRDISAQVLARDAIAESERRLRDSDRRKEEFLAMLAHELRNPLAPVCNALQILRLSNRAEPLHEMMERQINHIVRLVDDLLEISRISRGKIELKRAPVALPMLLRHVVDAARPLLAEARHELSVNLPEDPLLLDADPARVTQIFSNLLDNAIKYTPAGGHLWLTAARDGNQAVVSVRDDGAGIEPDMLARVFDLYAQVEATRGEARGGLGIGLSLTRELVRLHAGEIGVRSEGPGKGSEFTVRLPLAEERGAVPQDTQPKVVALGAISLRRVLVVDDNRDAADSLAMLLKFLGAEVQVAHDGAAALSILQTYRPAVILLDLGMPGMDGFEVARRVRKLHGASVKLVALTGWGQPQDRQRTREADFDHHLIKPADMVALQAVLTSLETDAPQRLPEPRLDPERLAD